MQISSKKYSKKSQRRRRQTHENLSQHQRHQLYTQPDKLSNHLTETSEQKKSNLLYCVFNELSLSIHIHSQPKNQKKLIKLLKRLMSGLFIYCIES